MKILVTTPYFHPHPGGSQRYIEELFTNLVKIDRNIKVDVLTYNTERINKFEKYGIFNIYRVGCWEILRGQFAFPNYFELIKFVKILKRNKYDIVNPHTRFFDNSWWSPFAAKYLGAKAILTDHCAFHPKHNNPIVQTVAMWVDIVFTHLLGKLYPHIAVVSNATKSFLVKSGVKTQITVIPGGVNLDEYKSKTHKKLDFFKKINNRDIVVSFVGRMIPSKGPQILLKVAKDFSNKKNIKFVFAGEGESYTNLNKLTNDNIIFTGNLVRSGVTALLKRTDILVHPSTHHEGLPSVILEAGAASCAVVATNRGGTSELITDCQTGLIIEPSEVSIENALNKLITDKALRNKLGNNLFNKVANNYNWDKISRSFLKYLKSIK